MAKNRLNIILGVDVGQLERSLKDVERRLQRFASNLQNTGRTLTESITLPLGGLGVAAVRTFAQFDKLEKGLSAVTGSAEEGSRQMQSLLNIVKDTRTTLDLQSAAKVSLQLQGVGLAAAEAEKLITGLAIAATATGQTADDVAEVGRQLSQSVAKGKVFQQELNILFDRLPALARIVKETFGQTTAEGLRNAGVSAQEFVTKLSAAIEADEKLARVKGGLGKAIESFGIELQIAAAQIGKTISESIGLETILLKISAAVSKASDFFKSLTPEAQRFIVISAAIAASIGPVLFVLGKLVALGPLLVSSFRAATGAISGLSAVFTLLTSPITAFIILGAGLVALVVLLNEKFIGFRKVLNGVIDFFIEFFNIAKELARPLVGIISGVDKAVRRDFAGAADAFKSAFSADIPGFQEIGVRLGTAFAGGFNDETNRIDEGIQALKGRIFKQAKEITSGLSSAIPPVTQGSGFPSEGSGGAGSGRSAGVAALDGIGAVAAPTAIAAQSIGTFNDRLKETATLGLTVQSAFKKFGVESAVNLENVRLIADNLGLTIDQLVAKMGAENVLLFAQRFQQLQALATNLANTVGGVLDSAFTAFFDTLASGGANAFGSFAQAAKQALLNVVKQLTAAVIKAAALAAIFTIISGGSAAGLAKVKSLLGFSEGSLFGNFFRGAAGFAQGGIVPPGFPNDTFPARLTSGEAVIPLDRLNQFTGGNNAYIAEARVSGDDLVVLLKRAEKKFNRYS